MYNVITRWSNVETNTPTHILLDVGRYKPNYYYYFQSNN